MKEYYLVTDAAAETVEKLTGLPGRNTLLGALVEKPPSLASMGDALWAINNALNPPKPRCCHGVIMHEPNCKSWGVVT